MGSARTDDEGRGVPRSPPSTAPRHDHTALRRLLGTTLCLGNRLNAGRGNQFPELARVFSVFVGGKIDVDENRPFSDVRTFKQDSVYSIKTNTRGHSSSRAVLERGC